MAIDSPEKLSKARELIQKAELKLNSQLERPDYSDDLPEVQRLKSVINSARSQVNAFESNSRQVDPKTNRLTADAGTGEEIRVGDGNALTNEYFYEPSLESVRDRMESDPGLAERLGLPKFGKREQMVGQQAIQGALQSQGMQPLPTVDTIDQNSSVYKAVADADWKERAERAKQEGKSLVRYSKAKLKDSPADTIVGGAIKGVGALASGVAQSIPGVRTISRAVDEELLREGRKPLEAAQTMDELVQQAPIPGAIGTIIGAARPGSIGNMVGDKVSKALKYADRGRVGKAAVAGASGAAGSVAEGEAYALDEAVASEDEAALDNFISQAGERATANAVLGYGMGKGGDILSQASRAGSESLRNFSPAVKGLRELENAGGDLRMPTGAVGVPVPGSAMLSPVRVPDEVMGNFRASSKDGEILSPIEIAANKVAPKIAESVDQQAQEAYRQAGESLEKYHNSPQGLAAKRVTKPAKLMLNMIREGQDVGDLGTVGDAVPSMARKLRERLMSQVERKEVGIDEYDRLKAQYGDDIIDLDPADADNLLGAVKQEPVQASVQPQVAAEPEPVVANPFDPPAKIMSPEATADTIPAPAAEPVDVRNAGTVPPKGKKKKAAGKVAGPAERDITPTNLYPQSNQARNEYGQKMYPYRDAMRGSDMRTENLMNEFPYVENAPAREGPSELELGKTEFPKDSPFPESVVEDLAASEVEELSVSPEAESAGPMTPVKAGNKVVLVPRARNSRQIERIQQDIANDLKGSENEANWLKEVDKAFRETRDQFEPNEFTPGEMTLDDGTKVTGLSALQRKHHELLQQIDEMKLDTSSKSKTAILNKIKAFASGQNGTADKELLEQARKLGLEKELRQVAATRVVPGLKTAGSPLENDKGIFTGLKNAGIQRILPVLEAVGNVPRNPFIAQPNTPAARIQQYLFENSARNLLNFEGGRLGRFGNEVQDLTEKDR
jgi:hypothetical protein